MLSFRTKSRTMLRPAKRCFWLLPLITLTALGCSDGSARLTGRLLAAGKPVPEGTISFRNTQTGAMARASVQPDGRYAVMTGSQAGLAPGEYEIAVAAVKGIPDPANPDKAKRWVPSRYANFETSGLTFTVKAGKQEHDIECEAGDAWR